MPRIEITAERGSRRDDIIDAAAALFAESGFRGTSIGAVASRVGMTDAGILHHFGTKQGLVLAVVQSHADGVQAAIDASGLRGIELLRLIREWGAGMEGEPEYSAMLIALTTEHLTGDSPARRAIQTAYHRMLDRYVAAFATAASNGDLRSDLDPVHEASALVAHLDGIRLQWFLTDRSFSMAESVRRYVDSTLDRLAPARAATP